MTRHVSTRPHPDAKLTVIRPAGKDRRGRLYDCLCDCGRVLHGVPASNLVSGNTKSCGCWSATARRLADPERDRRIWRMRRQGMLLREIGAEVGCSDSTVAQVLRKIRERRRIEPTYAD